MGSDAVDPPARGSQQHAGSTGNLAADETLVMAELRACPSLPAGSPPATGPGQDWQALAIPGGLEPQNEAWHMGQGWAEGPLLSLSPPFHRSLEMDSAGGVAQKARCGNCSLPCTPLPAVFSWWLQPLLLCLEQASKPCVSPTGPCRNAPAVWDVWLRDM